MGLFFHLLLQNFSPVLSNVLVFFVNFLKIKIRLETTENMLAGSANIILIFFQLRFGDVFKDKLDYKNNSGLSPLFQLS